MRKGLLILLLPLVILAAACGPLKNATGPAGPGVALPAKQIVHITARTLTWFYHLDKRLIYCQPGLAVKDTQATIYWLALNHLGYHNTVAYHRNATLCTELRTGIRAARHPHPKITRTVIVTVTPTP